ncbi:GntR family transcriptional regulator [Allorhodopirellula heiligendammensis]|uniref:HTH-type transcriptional regulator McbR n=1 Tax=Allorhodopirellula heiligendammensis TaxID=2714739 RepID=A0A5C6BZB5_9BACT|nr:GntR family transcriptional regulator [Allorhodopirellula heiligendammensis]TWU16274.1 HTH-type transcriptional regulator McbR [Allorhodopirellula heiligendammensis]
MNHETHASRAYQHLRNKLISGAFEPGTRLLYGPIGKEIGVSATPVREAAGQLANEGLVELVPQLGAIVRRIDRDELREIYEVREIIEPSAAALAAQRATPEQLASIESELNRMLELAAEQRESDSQYADKVLTGQFDKADYTFHIRVFESTGNRSLIRTASQSHVLTRVFGVCRYLYDADSMAITCTDHQQIFDAISSKDASGAKQAAVDHIRKGQRISLERLDAFADDAVGFQRPRR